MDRIDIVYIHDPDDHWQEAIDDAYPALHELRAQGVVGAIGAGMNQAEMLARFARETDMDVFLCAGRYTLLDQSALPELLPACEARGISLVIGGLLNSGILANPAPGARFDYPGGPAERAGAGAGHPGRLPCDTVCRCSRRRCSSRWRIPAWRRSSRRPEASPSR